MTSRSASPGGLILLGGDRTEADRTRARGIPTLLVTTPARARPGDFEHADRTLIVEDLDDPLLPAMLESLHRVTPFAACVSMTEFGLAPAARINQLLGLPGTSVETVEATRDKALMRERLDKHGIPPVAARVCRGVDDAIAFAGECGLPVIVKPIDGVGSHDVHLAASNDKLAAAVAELTAGLPGRTILVEEFLGGPEFSVETFSYGGRHAVLATVAKQLHPGTFVEIGHVTPAPALDERDDRDIRALVRAALDALGLTDGPAHTEVKLTPDGPRIVETHTRMGGDYIPFLVQMTTGHDLFDMTLAWAAGAAEPLAGDAVAHSAAAIRFLAPPPGRIDAVIGLERILAMPGVVSAAVDRRPGDTVPPVRSSDDRSGHVMTAAATADEALRRAVAALACIDIVVTT